MFWPQIVLNVNAESAAEVEDSLFSAGALSVIYQDEQDQPILEPAPGEVRLWDSIRMVGLFDAGTTSEEILKRCEHAYGRALPDCVVEELPDQNWERSWMKGFAPMQFGSRLWVCPSHSAVPDETAVNVKLDPGLAFGTGTHATTAQCLSWLDGHQLQGKLLVDYGCGSGVLGIAALLLGAQEVIAIDIDEQAHLATRENALRNELPVDGSRLAIGGPEQLEDLLRGRQADVMMANILFAPLVELAPAFAAVTAGDGRLVMSGVLENQVDELMLHYTQWFGFRKPSLMDDWALLEANRRTV